MGIPTYDDGKRSWRIDELWAAAEGLPIEHLIVSDLEHHLDTWSWGEDISIRSLATHARRMALAKPYPILLTPDGWIADGMHRLAWAWVMGDRTIAAQRFTTMPPPSSTASTPKPGKTT